MVLTDRTGSSPVSGILRVVLVVSSALLLALALPNELFHLGSPLFGTVALAPLLVALYHTPSYRQAAGLGVLFGTLSSLLTNYWLVFFQNFSVWTLGGVTVGYLGYHALLAPILLGAARAQRSYRPFAIAAVWTVYEYLKSSGFLGYPWGLIAYPVHAITPLIQFVEITGVWGLSLLMALVNAVAAEWLELALGMPAAAGPLDPPPVRGRAARNAQGHAAAWWPLRVWIGGRRARWLRRAAGRRGRPTSARAAGRASGGRAARSPATGRARWRPPVPARVWRASALVAGLVAAALAYGAAALQRPIPVTGSVDLVLVQHNSNPWLTGDAAATVDTLQRLAEQGIAAAAAPPDLVVWSETAVMYPVVATAGDPQPRLPAAVTRLPVPLLTGIPWLIDDAPVRAMNAAVLVDAGGRVLDHYGKRHLVPFAESVPFWEVPAVQRFFSTVVGLHATWVAGRDLTVFTLPLQDGGSVRFATPICFEDAFPYLNRRFVRAGADLLINLTNDAWSQTVSAETQHLVAAKLRTVENRRVLVRATNGGVTTAIDPWGRIIGTPAPLFTETALRLQVPVYRPQHSTLYTRFGDYLPAAVAALLLLSLARAAMRNGRRSGRRLAASASQSRPGGPAKRMA